MKGKKYVKLIVFDITASLIELFFVFFILWLNIRFKLFSAAGLDVFDLMGLIFFVLFQFIIGIISSLFVIKKISVISELNLVYRKKLSRFVYSNLWFIIFFAVYGVKGKVLFGYVFLALIIQFIVFYIYSYFLTLFNRHYLAKIP